MSSDFPAVPETVNDPFFTSVFDDRDFNTGGDITRPIISKRQIATDSQNMTELEKGEIIPGMSMPKEKDTSTRKESNGEDQSGSSNGADSKKPKSDPSSRHHDKHREGKEKSFFQTHLAEKQASKSDHKGNSDISTKQPSKKNSRSSGGASLFPSLEDLGEEGNAKPTESEVLAKFSEKCKTIGLIPREQWRVAVSKRYYANGSDLSEGELDAIVFGMNLFRQYNSISESHDMLNALFGELESIKVTSKELRDTNDSLLRAIDNNTNAVKRGIFEGIERAMASSKKVATPEQPKKQPPSRKVNWDAPLKIEVHSPRKNTQVEKDQFTDESSESDGGGELARKEQTFLRKADLFLESVGVIPSDRKNPTMIVALRKCISDSFIDKCLNEGLSKKEKREAYALLEITVKKLISKGKNYQVKQDPVDDYDDDSDDEAV